MSVDSLGFHLSSPTLLRGYASLLRGYASLLRGDASLVAAAAGTTAMMVAMIRAAYTIEQCWHPSPGGTAIAALRIARELRRRPDDVELHLVAGKHPVPPPAEFRPEGPVAMLPLSRPLLYETWTRLNWPKVESVAGEIDVAHATGLVPCGTSAPLVVTVHDLAFVHDPAKFSAQGVRTMNRSLDMIIRRADLVIVSSEATRLDCIAVGMAAERLRLVPLGVDIVDRVRCRHRSCPPAIPAARRVRAVRRHP